MVKPLDGITILDFSRVLAAPLATQILADLGATVIKIERPGSGDETRAFEPRVGEGESAYFFAFNRGKKSVVLDLKSEQGRNAALELVREADVVVENFVPGTMDALGLGYDALRERNAKLIYVTATGFGQTGPERMRKGYDTIFQALSGVMSLTGHPGMGPAKVGVPIADMSSGLWVAIAVLSGLVGRGLHGRGTFIDVSMMDVQISLLALAAARVFALDEEPTALGTEHPGRVPSAAFRCADGWIHVSASDQHWQAMCRVLGLDDLGRDPELARNGDRVEHRARVMARLEEAFAGWTVTDAVEALQSVEVPVGEVRGVRQALDAPQTMARGMVGEFDHPAIGAFPALRTPLVFDAYESPGFAPPPTLGQHTDEVLDRLLARQSTGSEAMRQEGDHE